MKIELITPPYVPANEVREGYQLPSYCKITFDLDAVDKWLRDEASDEIRDECAYDPIYDDDEGFIEHNLTCAHECVWEMLYTFGLRWENNQLTFICGTRKHNDIQEQFDGMQAVPDLVHAAYEHSAPDISSWTGWLTGLSGDDDVDYNGSYIEMGTTALKHYLLAHVDQLPLDPHHP